MSKHNKNIKWGETGVSITIDIPEYKVRKGHKTHRGGSGIHADKRLKRVRGNQAKKAWLYDD